MEACSQLPTLCHFTSGERAPSNRWIQLWVSHHITLDALVKKRISLSLNIYQTIIVWLHSHYID